MTAAFENEFAPIAGADIGWKSVLAAKTFWNGKPCRACSNFEMRMIKARETDAFGHLLPYCTNPLLPGAGGYQTQILSTCDHWSAK